ncbi:Lipid II:glycine glycyltransferase (Peptidoglycan interpeptide bridge formation enzyme) [Microlunatus sagamiharensis]|uniref:Lipid II:glycine glycyltransferase (Peptidoglycan interpeptide bridge formation enzyme) n=1 Tax=Microlunatus sagamiharensis TaxID=546874 RepID=A0A1H2NB56_9ACTN|nr:peptidoglycan bridge formation glycyltransferase FemA/FemB family protein [Microlunatus sagamiharensis]SDV02335.1 Lipid II:glycine glycyltransferase (Peptidoglycan interpeptide bridge formation enzyme) [Microlunatus sagamiharensis]
MALEVRTITAEEHRRFNAAQPSVSFLQTPAWGEVKSEWKAESVGWFDDLDPEGPPVGAGLVLYRQLPRLKKYLAYLPEGPNIDWLGGNVHSWLVPLAGHLKKAGAFGIRIGPPVVSRRWGADTVKRAIADERITRLSEAVPDEVQHRASALRQALRDLGWHPPSEDEGFAAGQPRFVFQLPLDGETPESLLAGMNQLWRRNIKKADKAGVVVTEGGRGDLAAFHPLYVETAERDRFTPRPLAYFETMWDALRAEDDDRIRLYLAHHEGDLVAATTWVRVGQHAWYSYGASSTAKRDVRGSNAVQWRMVRDALEAGASVYDLRGITEGLEADDPHLGLIQFKVGTGGQAVELLGEWDLPLNPLLYRAFDVYMRRR